MLLLGPAEQPGQVGAGGMRLVSQLGAEQRRVDESLAGDGERQRLQRREGRLRLPRRGQVARVLLGKRLEERVRG